MSIKGANEEVFDLLIEKGASTTTDLGEKAEYNTLALPVCYAASAGNVHILCRLLEAGLEADSAFVPDG